MTSRLVKAVRKILRIQPRPRRPAPDCVREGHIYRLTHETYGKLKILAEDQYISWHVLDGRGIWELGLVKTFEREIHGGKNVLDVGANLGLHTIRLSQHLSRLGKGGKVIAFEPHPEIFELAKYNCSAYPNIECINKAASNVAGSFYMPSIVTEINAGGFGLQANGNESMHKVESITIDSLQLDNIGFMKIDVEGHEVSCIQGAAETIRRCRPTMVIEIMGGQDVKTAPPEVVQEIHRRVDLVCSLGYTSEQVSEHDYLFRPRQR